MIKTFTADYLIGLCLALDKMQVRNEIENPFQLEFRAMIMSIARTYPPNEKIELSITDMINCGFTLSQISGMLSNRGGGNNVKQPV